MIVSFGDRATEDLFHGIRSNRVRRFPANIVEAALVKLDVLNAAQVLGDLRSRQVIALKLCMAIFGAFIAFASTISGVLFSAGKPQERMR